MNFIFLVGILYEDEVNESQKNSNNLRVINHDELISSTAIKHEMNLKTKTSEIFVPEKASSSTKPENLSTDINPTNEKNGKTNCLKIFFYFQVV